MLFTVLYAAPHCWSWICRFGLLKFKTVNFDLLQRAILCFFFGHSKQHVRAVFGVPAAVCFIGWLIA
jgi:hypothetical protein